VAVGNGRCIKDGPFRQSQRLYFDNSVLPHCISRAFRHFQTGKNGTLFGGWFHPAHVRHVRNSSDLETFGGLVERSFHNVLHDGVRGDFESYSAANGMLVSLFPTPATNMRARTASGTTVASLLSATIAKPAPACVAEPSESQIQLLRSFSTPESPVKVRVSSTHASRQASWWE
jgi:hypothetical protein